MKIIKTINIILIIALILIGTYYLFIYNPVNNSLDYIYITDTIKVPKPYPVPEPYEVPTDPRIITIYKTDTSLIAELKLRISKDSIFIEGLKDSISI